MTAKEKIKQYLDSKGISKNKFYTTTGLSVSFLDSGNTIGVDKAKIIIETYPDISIEWLILDKGPMIKEKSIQSSDNSEKLWNLINSQQKMLESQQRIIENLSQKGAAEGVTAVAQKAARG